MDQIRDHDKTIKNIHHTRLTDESKDSFWKTENKLSK
jgi:hypothetical protein